MLVQPAEGMSEDQMKEIEEKCDVYPAIEVTTPRTVAEQTSKEYPRNSAEQKENDNPLAKYRVDAPQWFDQLTNPEAETPVIQVGGDKTPSLSDSDLQYELNVPMLNSELEIAKQTPKNGLALLSSDDEDNEQKQSEHTKSEAPTLSLNTDQIANED